MNPYLTRPVALAFALVALTSCNDTPTEPESATSPVPDAELAVAANSWSTRANMPSDRFDPAVAVVTNAQGQTVLYAIAGTTNAGGNVPLGKVQAYNAATNTWTTRASLPVALRNTNGAGAINGRIYLSGGHRYNGSIVPYLFEYNPATDRWTRKRDLPNSGFGGVTGVYQNKLYVLTYCQGVANEPGCGASSSAMGVYRYDPAADQWTFLSVAPRNHFGGMGGFIGGRFYLTGGASASPEEALDVYDPATNSWDTRAPMPSGRFRAAYAAIGVKLYIVGGTEKDVQTGFYDLSRSMIRYDPASNSWTTLAPLPSLRNGLAGGRVVVNGQARFEVVGGARPGNNLQYTP